jgi:hypothetical protein
MFGAGASIGTIPVVKDFLNGAKELLDSIADKNENKLKENLEFIITELPAYASIDTLIRKLHIQKNPLEKELNATLIAIIHYLQLNNPLDKRYDLFLGNLITIDNGKLELPRNVNFISWNYDRLFEFSLSILLNSDLNEVRQYVNIFNNYETIENKNKPYLIKLNGSAGAFIDSQYKKDSKEQIIHEVISNYTGTIYKAIPDSMIQFAWDENENTKKSRLKAIEITNATQILVVVGYSFPTFNRKIDKELLKDYHKFKKIILQNTKDNIDSVTDRLMALVPALEPNKLVKITDEFEFHMPIEI